MTSTAIVTGASRGIGAETARLLVAQGFAVYAVARSAVQLQQRARDAVGPGELIAMSGDLEDLDFARSVIDSAVALHGGVDVLVNNAAWRELGTMRTVSLESWERTLRVCLTVPAFLSRWAAETMAARGRGGVIVNVSSIQADRAPGLMPQYVAAKGGLDALTRDLATLYGPSDIRVVAVHPGTIATDVEGDYRTPDGRSTAEERTQMVRQVIPLRRRGTASEVARVIVWLAGPEASYITGSTITVDGGWGINLTPYDIKRLTFPDEFPV